MAQSRILYSQWRQKKRIRLDILHLISYPPAFFFLISVLVFRQPKTSETAGVICSILYYHAHGNCRYCVSLTRLALHQKAVWRQCTLTERLRCKKGPFSRPRNQRNACQQTLLWRNDSRALRTGSQAPLSIWSGFVPNQLFTWNRQPPDRAIKGFGILPDDDDAFTLTL